MLGEPRRAHREVIAYLAEHPEDGRGWELLGLVYHALHEWGQAMEALELATLRVPLRLAGVLALGDCYLAHRRWRWAAEHYAQVVRDAQASPTLLLRAAAGLDRLGLPRFGVEACRKATRLDPTLAQPFYDLSYYLLRAGGTPGTIEAAARRAIHLDPERWSYRVGLASYLHQQGRTADGAMLLKPATPAMIATMGCRCCLNRLIELWSTVGAEEPVAWCRARIAELAARGEQDECGRVVPDAE
jgi:tetratricopeptide (TPR) repeat protein